MGDEFDEELRAHSALLWPGGHLVLCDGEGGGVLERGWRGEGEKMCMSCNLCLRPSQHIVKVISVCSIYVAQSILTPNSPPNIPLHSAHTA